MSLTRELVASHWGVYEVLRAPDGGVRLGPLAEDPNPSPIGLHMRDAYRRGPRVLRPAVRAGWLEHGPGHRTASRGAEPFVEVSWDEATRLVAEELVRVKDRYGNSAIFGGSYGWASAGRFHHAQSQLRRFMNTIGGCVQRVDSYSLGAGRVIMPHVVAGLEDRLLYASTDWQTLAEHTRLMVSFGGLGAKNAQVMAGGPSRHLLPDGLARLAAAGCRFVNFSPLGADCDLPAEVCEWMPIRPGTDAAVMIALATEIVLANRHDAAFLSRYCVGFDRWERYLRGRDDGVVKNAQWGAAISGLDAARLRSLAFEMAREERGRRTMITAAWSLQRAEHGEQPYWAAVALASVIGHVGLPGGGFALGYGTVNSVGSRARSLSGPTLPMGQNAVTDFIPVARLSDMLLDPGGSFDYNGARYVYPDIRLVYWAGGNPFHHHQDLNRLLVAWRRPETIIVHEQVWNAHARHADIVLPATSTLERDDIGYAQRDPLLVAMRGIDEPPGQARNDFDIFAQLAGRMGVESAFTEGRTAQQWLRAMWDVWRERIERGGVQPPPFDEFWDTGCWRVPDEDRRVVLLEAFRADPDAAPLPTPSGRIELFSARVSSFGYADCPGHPTWLEPAEWLGGALADRFPLHLVTDQPRDKLHSQLDFSELSRGHKVQGREPLLIHPEDAARRGVQPGAVVRVFNDRGACLAGAVVTTAIRRGVVKLSTGAWWDPEHPGRVGCLDKHGNPNVLTRDVGASKLSQGCAAQTCLVDVERYDGPPPALTAFDPPRMTARDGTPVLGTGQ